MVQIVAGIVMLLNAASPVEYDGVPNGAVARLGTTRFRVPGRVDRVCFSPNGAYVASVVSSGSFRLDHVVVVFDAATGQRVALIGGDEKRVAYDIAFTPDGDTLVSNGQGGIRCWSTRDWKQTRRLNPVEEYLGTRVAISPTGRMLGAIAFSGDRNTFLDLWNVDSGERLRRIRGRAYCLDRIAFSPDGGLIAGGSGIRKLRVWDCSSGAIVFTFDMPDETPEVHSVAFSRDGGVLAVGSYGGGGPIYLWDISRQTQSASVRMEPRKLIGHASAVDALAYSPDGALLASGSHDQTIRFWDTATGTELARLEGHREGVRSLDFSRDARWLASGDYGGTIRVWDVAKRAARDPVEPNEGTVESVAFAPDGRTMASGGQDRMLRIWDVGTRTSTTIGRHPDYGVAQVAFSPDGRLALVADGAQRRPSRLPRSIRAYDMQTKELVFALPCGEREITCMAVSLDGRFIASSSNDSFVRLWDLSTKQPLWEFEPPVNYRPTNVALSPRGDLMAITGHGRTVQVWNRSLRQQLRELTGHSDTVSSLAFSADGAYLISGSGDNTARIWDPYSREQIACLGEHAVGSGDELPDSRLVRANGHVNSVTCVTCSPDGRLIATGSVDGTIRLWSSPTGHHLATLEGHEGNITSVAFSPDSRLLVSASTDTTMLVWDVEAALKAKP
jgi:WD40 repeat protein